MRTFLDAATAIPIAVWAAIAGLAVASFLAALVIAATFHEDAEQHELEAERAERIRTAARGWGHH